MNRLARYLALATVAALTACGGGGSDSASTNSNTNPTPPIPAKSAEGFWNGKASSGFDVSLAVLENGETWGVYTKGGFIYGALYGQTTSSNGALTGTSKDFDLRSGTVASSDYSGTYTGQNNISIRAAGGTITANYSANYDQPATLAALAGTYSGQGVATGALPQSTPITISPSGILNMPSSLGCAASGTVTPRPGGKNVFNLSITFSGASCALGNGATASGVGYYEGGKFLAMGLLPSKAAGFIFIGQK